MNAYLISQLPPDRLKHYQTDCKMWDLHRDGQQHITGGLGNFQELDKKFFNSLWTQDIA